MKNSFEYNYSAKEQAEVKRIREKYIPREEDKMEQLRRLDKSVTNKATVLSLVLGIVGSLVMGSGMCLCMVWNRFFIGIPVGLVGIALVALAYPAYSRTLSKEREKVAPLIIQLSDELLK